MPVIKLLVTVSWLQTHPSILCNTGAWNFPNHISTLPAVICSVLWILIFKNKLWHHSFKCIQCKYLKPNNKPFEPWVHKLIFNNWELYSAPFAFGNYISIPLLSHSFILMYFFYFWKSFTDYPIIVFWNKNLK